MSLEVGALRTGPEFSNSPGRPSADAPVFSLFSGSLPPPHRSGWRRAEAVLWAVAGCAAIILALAAGDRALFRAHAVRALDDRIADGSSATGRPSPEAPGPGRLAVAAPVRVLPFVARLEVPTLALTALLVDGVDARTLSRAVGRIPSSSLPGDPGDVALAGHRDTDFRDLGRLRRGEPLILRTAYGEFRYEVESIRIVTPIRVDVLTPAGYPTLTLVTCYPFRYVGPAPLRYVVRAREVARPSRATS